MKTLIIVLIVFPILINAQVGINTATPNATLAIKATNEVTPLSTDGILVPKIEEFPTTNPTTLQDGMIIFATGAGSVTKGFYYWNHTANSWTTISNGANAEKINDLLDGKSDNDGINNGRSIFLGIDAGLNDDGSKNHNIGLGLNTLYTNETGSGNNAIGFQTLYNNLLGEHNVANGYKALVYNTNGSDNIATGYEALYHNTTGKKNTALGFKTLRQNTVGDYNIGIGNKAGYYAKGDRNIFIGNEAGEGIANYNIDRSIFLGNQAGRYETNSDRLYIENSEVTTPLIYGKFTTNVLRIHGELQVNKPIVSGYKLPVLKGAVDQILKTDSNGAINWVTNITNGVEKIDDLLDGKSDNDGTDNGSSIFLGNDAGLNNDSSDNRNIGIGFQSLYNNTTGYKNTTTGNLSLYENTIGHSNTANGSLALYNNTTGHSNTANGSLALYWNRTGHSNTAIGQKALYNNRGNENTAIGSWALLHNNNNDYNTGIGVATLRHNNWGDYNTAIGTYTHDSGLADDPTNSISLNFFNNSSVTNKIDIGTSSVTAISGQVNFSTYSDARVKDNIKEDVKGLEFITKLRPVTYNFNIDRQNKLMGVKDTIEYPEKYDLEKIKMSGFIAQEVEKAAKYSNYNFSGVKAPKNSDDLYGLSYAEFVVPLVKAVQEQQTELETIKQELAEIKALLLKKLLTINKTNHETFY